jgi:hypothetical protein
MAADRSTCGQLRLRSLAPDFTPAAGQPARRLLRHRGPGRVALMGQLTSASIMNVDAPDNLTGTIQTQNRTPVTGAAFLGRKIAIEATVAGLKSIAVGLIYLLHSHFDGIFTKMLVVCALTALMVPMAASQGIKNANDVLPYRKLAPMAAAAAETSAANTAAAYEQ